MIEIRDVVALSEQRRVGTLRYESATKCSPKTSSPLVRNTICSATRRQALLAHEEVILRLFWYVACLIPERIDWAARDSGGTLRLFDTTVWFARRADHQVV